MTADPQDRRVRCPTCGEDTLRLGATFAERVVYLRGLHDLGVRELARRADLSPGLIVKYEKGDTEPGMKSLAALARALSTSTDFLIFGEPND